MLNASIVRKDNTTEYDTDGFPPSFEVYKWIIYPLTVFCSLCGLVGNGMVIWILTSCTKRNPFTTYILNLAIADFGTLLSLSARVIILAIDNPYTLVYELVDSLTFFTYSTSLYFLTAISLERCISVLFPIWFRCQRQRRTSAVVSLLLWIVSGLLSGTLLVFDNLWLIFDNLSYETYLNVLNTIFTINLLILTPIMVGSTFIMSIRICRKSQRRQPPRLYIAILVTLLFFIIFAIPLSVTYFILLNGGPFYDLIYESSFLLASFNSSINPIIYYFVGRCRNRQRRESLKFVLQQVFKDEADLREGN
ncbi:mas-related G-protein coupled receptor member H-like [Eublepharis macularius]|uniref:Mas-related G-protein coupled receptor member H-like n=1 Tax=Eublepharis macularius TaxID=481883 RepID=A0AA97L6Y3_EUBMA|nr:mas-related G-protein coupled receptor member H-like [Eublepharis macularius]